MKSDDHFEAAFNRLKSEFKQKPKKDFLDEVRGHIEDNEQFQEFLTRSPPRMPLVAVTYDRHRNDKAFSYPHFDFLLDIIDQLGGGSGLRKPANQLRMIRWNARRRDLRTVLLAFSRADPRLRFRRLLILPYPVPPVGVRLDPAVLLKRV